MTDRPGPDRQNRTYARTTRRGAAAALRATVDGDLEAVAEQFGADEEQVRRDYAISHTLAAIGAKFSGEVLFIGGTALSRTHLTLHRLSEDIDLVVRDRTRRWVVVDELSRFIPDAIRDRFGPCRWAPPFERASDTESAIVVTGSGVAVKIQALAGGHEAWPTEIRKIEQRYSDVPETYLTVPTRDSAVCMKTVAWADRRAPRDLYDLWALDSVGAFTEGVLDAYHRAGPGGRGPGRWAFETPPSSSEWRSQLAAQTRLTVGPKEALATVRSAWARPLGEDWSG